MEMSEVQPWSSVAPWPGRETNMVGLMPVLLLVRQSEH